MKRLLTVLVLTMVVLAVVAAPVYAKGGPVFRPAAPGTRCPPRTLAAATLPGTTAHVIRGRGVATGVTPTTAAARASPSPRSWCSSSAAPLMPSSPIGGSRQAAASTAEAAHLPSYCTRGRIEKGEAA